jgi:hypothetical protein
MRQRFIDNKYVDFRDVDAIAKGQNKSLRQAFIEMEEAKEKMARNQSTLIKDYQKNTQFFHDSKFFADSEASQFPIDAFQILDLTVNLPLNKYWAQELVPIRYGGGAVESFAFFRSNIGLGEGRLAGGNTNEVPLVSVASEKKVVPIYAIKLGILLGNVDLMKAQTINFDILERHEDALRTSYWREIEYMAFEGNVGIADITTSTTNFFPGLLNIPTTGSGIGYSALSAEQWSAHDVSEWTTTILTIIEAMKRNVRYNRDFYPNMALLGPDVWTLLAKPAVIGAVGDASGAGIATSIMQYIQREIKSRLQVEIEFVELPYLQANAEATYGFPIEASGANSTGRIVFYRRDEKVIKMPITMALTGGAMAYSPTEDGYRKVYVAFAGPLAIIYPESIYYLDNKAG